MYKLSCDCLFHNLLDLENSKENDLIKTSSIFKNKSNTKIDWSNLWFRHRNAWSISMESLNLQCGTRKSNQSHGHNRVSARSCFTLPLSWGFPASSFVSPHLKTDIVSISFFLSISFTKLLSSYTPCNRETFCFTFRRSHFGQFRRCGKYNMNIQLKLTNQWTCWIVLIIPSLRQFDIIIFSRFSYWF